MGLGMTFAPPPRQRPAALLHIFICITKQQNLACAKCLSLLLCFFNSEKLECAPQIYNAKFHKCEMPSGIEHTDLIQSTEEKKKNISTLMRDSTTFQDITVTIFKSSLFYTLRTPCALVETFILHAI